jgi:hypothetical protein
MPYTNINGLQQNQRNQCVWEPLKNFKFGGQPKMSSFSVIRGYVWFIKWW